MKKQKSHEKPPTFATSLRAASKLSGLPYSAVHRAKASGCAAFRANGNVHIAELLAAVSGHRGTPGDGIDYFTERAKDIQINRMLKEQKLAERKKQLVHIDEVNRNIVRNVIAAKVKLQTADSSISAEASMRFSLSNEQASQLSEIVKRHIRTALTELFKGEWGRIECPTCKTEIKSYE